MRKRRVLALLLALSLVVSGNGMTVLAAEQGADMPVFNEADTVDEVPADIVDDEEENTSGVTEDTTEDEETEDTSDGAETPEEGEEPDGDDKTAEEENPENPDNPGQEGDGQDGDQNSTEDGDGQEGDQNPAEDGDPDGDQSDTEDGDNDGQVEEPDAEEQEPAADAEEPSVSENDVDETKEPEEEPEEKTGEIRMMTFTDASGLKITFDANAAEENAEKVTIVDGVLTGIDESVEGVVDLRKVSFTEIGESAFEGRVKVTYVMLPKSVTRIGKNGFFGCTNLKGISILSGLTTIDEGAFQDCERLTQLAVPNSVVSIGANAFKGDRRLFMVNMASADYSKLTTIGDSAFEGCSALEFFCSDDDYNLPDSLTTIGAGAFKNCSSVVEVDMPDGITSLGESAYQGCVGIQKAEISGGLVTISGRAFADCSNLIELEFSTEVRGTYTTIESLAFENCRKLVSVELPQNVTGVKANAFQGCTALQRIYIKFNNAVLEDSAFPNANAGLCILGEEDSAAHDYATRNGGLRFIAIDAKKRLDYYTYTKNVTDPTGKIVLTVTKEISVTAKDINTITNKDGVAPYDKGVKAGTECFVMINWGQYMNILRLVPGSLRCNGEEIDYDKNRRVYYFEMPNGGAAITAEFEYIDATNIVPGDESTIDGRLSSDVNYDYERKIAYMQEGQSAKFYLTNSAENKTTRIPASKIKYRVEKNSTKGVISVDAEGEVKALKEGTAIVEAVVNTNGGEVIKYVTIVVKKASAIDHIRVQLDENKYKSLTVDKDGDDIIGVSLPTDVLVSGEYEFDIEANAFKEDDDEEMKVAFTWASSDAKVAKVKKASTAAGSSENRIIIPKGADGEATITITATDKEKRKTTKKFVVSVQNYAPRLTASKVTVNPKQERGTTTIGIIDAYGHQVVNDDSKKKVQAYIDGSPANGFIFDFVGRNDASGVSTYKISATPLVQKTYNVKLGIYVKVGTEPKLYETPLTIVVKESEPKPTVSFDKKAEKINLFLANDGVEIQPVIGKLGDAVVSAYRLEPLTESTHANYKDDVLFTENFQIDAKTGTITQKAADLKKNSKGKPVLTGNLVLKFEGYGDLEKKCKITIPTKTVAPSYVLERTTDTFGSGFKEKQTVDLLLLDKKTKKPIEWDEGFKDGLEPDNTSTFPFAEAALVSVREKVDGVNKECVAVRVTIPGNPAGSGKLVMRIRNSKWAEGKEFKYTYNIKIDGKSSKLSLKKATITLNANYPERSEAFEIVSNHRNEVITGEQDFEAQSTAKNAAEYQKLNIVCKDGAGSVSLKNEATDIKAGSYRFVHKYKNTEGKENKVTLTVKVNKATPTVTLKGTNAFNLRAMDGDKYVEVSEMTVTVKNLPDNPKYLETETTEPEQPDIGDGDNQGGSGDGTGGGDNQGGSGDGTGDGDNQGGSGDGTGDGGNQGGSGDGTGDGGNQGGSGDGTGDSGNQSGSGDDSGSQPQQPVSVLAVPMAEPTRKINEEFYRLDVDATRDSLEITTKKYEDLNVKEFFDFQWVEDENGAGGKFRITLKQAMDVKTYTLRMTPTFSNMKDGRKNVIRTAKPVSFKIKVFNSAISSVKLSAKGKMNLLDRRPENVAPEDFEYTEKNGIRYTPKVANLTDTLKEVRLLTDDYPSIGDYGDETKLSTLFEARITEDKKSFYIVPKEDAELEKGKTYKVYVWLLMDGYKFGADTGNGIYTSTPIKVTTAEILPKVKTDQTTANLFLSSKAYEATFIVKKSDEKAVGSIADIAFGEKDEKANDSFEVKGETQEDGSLKVHLKLKNGVTYGCNTTNKIKMYIKFTGQGTNTAGTPITMSVKINK